ncbi:MarR family transcriptional regulator [Clostridia bacterium]|nr:MarR family transcriptional regulator [Clostridia bacterium]
MNNELYERLTRLGWLLHRQQMYRFNHGGHLADATRGQGRILAALKMQDGISTKDLSYLLGLAVSSLNEFLSKLEKGGYITREASEQDKRIMLVKLTEKGKAQQEQPEETKDLGDIFTCLSDEEQKVFEDYLDRVITVLEKQIGIDGDAEMENWMKAARSRMGGDMFDRFMSMRGGFGRLDRRGLAPKDMPGAERFSPDCNGPMPKGRSHTPCGRKSRPSEK